MVRSEISKWVGKRVVVEADVSVAWDGHRVAWCVENGVVRRDGAPIDHSWIQVRDNRWASEVIGRNAKRGDKVQIRGVIGSYTKVNGCVDYNIQDIDSAVIVGQKVQVR